MKRLVVLLAVGMVALIVQGAVATVLRPPFCPDLALLVVLVIALRWNGLVLGFVLAALLGFAADLLSGSLMGQHALLRLLAYVGAYFAGGQLNLKGSIPVAIFGASVSLLYGLALVVLTGFFVGDSGFAWRGFADLSIHSVINGVFAPWIFALVTRALAWSGDPESAARTLHIDAQGGAT
jgi:rod shape-determining protein MreD